MGDTGCSCRHYSISHIVFFLPSLDSIIARRRPLRAQYERTPRHCKRELLGCIIRNDTNLLFIDDFQEILYIFTRNSNRLKPSGESVSFVYQKAKGP